MCKIMSLERNNCIVNYLRSMLKNYEKNNNSEWINIFNIKYKCDLYHLDTDSRKEMISIIFNYHPNMIYQRKYYDIVFYENNNNYCKFVSKNKIDEQFNEQYKKIKQCEKQCEKCFENLFDIFKNGK